MADIFKKEIIKSVSEAIKKDIDESIIETPPNKEMGDYAFPCFVFAKELKKSPVMIAKELSEKIKPNKYISSVKAIGPYVNFFVVKEELSKRVLKKIFEEKKDYGSHKKKDNIILVESPGPNTNKPLHLGHVRNMVLGNALQNIFDFLGNKTKRIDIVNDRGVHICKSMLAYRKFGHNKEPDKKTDHFVGDYYVKYDIESKKNPELEKEIQEMLVAWENNDKETRKLWKKMNDWAVSGMQETYKRYGVKMDKPYYESEHYTKGRDIVLKGIESGLFKKDETGNIYYSDKDIEKKIVLRADGTSIYITQDISLGKIRYDDWHMDRMIYVVANEQIHHFKVLFKIFERLGYPFAKNCYHLAYGMIYLPEGKMKSREGTVVDADNLADEMHETAKKELMERYPDLDKKELEKRAEEIGMGAIKFYILCYDPMKDFVFNPKESISFEGETGPYVQYTHARCSSVIKKFGHKISEDVDYSLLNTDEEKAVLRLLEDFPSVVEKSAEEYRPSMITRHLLDLSQAFNEYYHKHKIIQDDKELEKARVLLVSAVKQVLEIGLNLLGISAPDVM
jgi:arginyl-tRNA synthetase